MYNGFTMAESVGKVKEVRKRDGGVVAFEPSKIQTAIGKAFAATHSVRDEPTGPSASSRLRKDSAEPPLDALTAEVVQRVAQRMAGQTPGVEQVQDAVEEALMANGYPDVARAYILYRHGRAEVRDKKRLLGVQDDLKLTVNAVKVLERRYLLRDDDGRLAETPEQMLRRVARAVAAVESTWTLRQAQDRPLRRAWDSTKEVEEAFFSAMAALEFLPNSPTLMNAGGALGQLSACFVIPVEDSMGRIFDAVKSMALIHQSGGGTGFSFSQLRPKGDIVKSTQGIASGPVSFMRVFDTGTDVIKQGGKRRGANMGILRVDHPDILEFIEAKTRDGVLSNFNVSVAVTDDFMEAVERDSDYPLINPRSGRAEPAGIAPDGVGEGPVQALQQAQGTGRGRRLSARHVFNLIATSAWKSGDPGLLFIDEINRANPTPQLGSLDATNPCGELPLLPYESCNLGSVNLSRMVRDGEMDFEKLRRTVHLGVRFLDDVIEANRYPLPEIEAITRGNRKIGLGVMGYADALLKLGLPYNTDEALAFARRVMSFVKAEALEASRQLAEERGPFPNFPGSVHDRPGGLKLRNATVTSIAPTGTISIIAGCSSGIEPLFALSYVRNVMEGVQLLEVNPEFERVAREGGFYTQELISEVARTGGVAGMEGVPAEIQRLFVTDFDIAPEWHVRTQAAFQEHCDNAVSKTINLPNEATVEDVREAYLLAYKLKCKGLTVFRYGSKSQQVLYRGGSVVEGKGEIAPFVSAASEYAGGCPGLDCEF